MQFWSFKSAKTNVTFIENKLYLHVYSINLARVSRVYVHGEPWFRSGDVGEKDQCHVYRKEVISSWITSDPKNIVMGIIILYIMKSWYYNVPLNIHM